MFEPYNGESSVDPLEYEVAKCNNLRAVRDRIGSPSGVPAQVVFVGDLDEVLAELRALLIQKNAAYGDSALNPVRILTKADPRELILARIDDKLKRIQLGSAAGEDVWLDLLGYFALLRIYDQREKRKKPLGSGG